jgi:hypothetical protein
MKKLFIIFTLLLAIIAGAGGMYSPTNYNSSGLEYSSDGIKYDEKTNIVYVDYKNKIARWKMNFIEKQARKAGQTEYYIEKGVKGNKIYKRVLVKKVIYDKGVK